MRGEGGEGLDFLHLQRVWEIKISSCSLILNVHRLEIDDRMKSPHEALVGNW